MNRKEIINLLAIATANFPNMQEKDMKPTAILWEKSLSDMDYNVAEKAVIKVLSTSRFFPTLAEIREAAADLTQPRTLDSSEAWGLVVQAIRRYGYYRQAEAMESLPDEVVRMVQRFSWQELCHSENVDTLRAQWRMAWDTQSKRDRETKALPADIREMLEGIGNQFRLGSGE